MQTQCCTEAHCSPLGYFTIQSAILRLLEAAAAAAFRGSRLRSFVHCNVVKSLRFHYDYIVLSFRISISFPSPRPSLPRSPPTPRLVFHFLILIFLFRTSRRDISFPILFNLVSCILFVSQIFSAREREREILLQISLLDSCQI